MKKILSYLVVTFVLILAVTGCKSAENESKNSVLDSGAVSTTMLEGNGTGLWFMLSNGIAESLNKNYEGSIINITPGNTNTNILRLNENQAEIALSHSNLAYLAFRGEGNYEEKLENIRAVATFYPSYAQFIVLENIGINSIDEFFEMKPKLKLSIGPNNSSSEVGFLCLLEAYGYTIEDLEAWGCSFFPKNHTESLSMMSDGAIDGMFVISSAPNPSVVECSTNKNLKFLESNSEKNEYIVENYGFSKSVIKGGLYNFAEEDIETFATYTFMAASIDTPEETVYKILKSINNNLDYIRAIHASLEDLNPEYLMDHQTIPMHPGAERYYKEIKLIPGD